MKEYQFLIRNKNENNLLRIILEKGDPDRSQLEFIKDLQYGVEELFPNATVVFQGATQ
jgi:hypothetical protein